MQVFTWFASFFKNDFIKGLFMFDWIKDLSFIDISTVILSIVASVVSIRSLWISKTQTISTVITDNRIDWINSVRTLVQQFMEEYLKGNESQKYIKQKLSANILLYLRHDVSIYKVFTEALYRCTENDFSESDYSALLYATQDMLNDVWNRMKREAGISKRSEAKIKKKLKKEKMKSNK